jgi:hypothetical protein
VSSSTRRALGATAAAFATVILAACGGEAGRGETSTVVVAPAHVRAGQQLSETPVTARVSDPVQRAYVSKVDAICKKLDRERNSAREQAAAGAESAAGTRAYDDTIALGERQLREIRSVQPPPGESKLLRTNVFDVLDKQLQIRREMRTALGESDLPKLQKLRIQLDSLTQSLLGFARAYGFRVCGED